MAFNPFEEKEPRAAIARTCKGASTAGLRKLFNKVAQSKQDAKNLHPGGVSSELSGECLALAEVVAAGRGNGNRNAPLPDAAVDWLEHGPQLNDALVKAAREAVDKVRTYSGASAIAEEMGGWPEWTSYCRGLSTRLGKPVKPAKLSRQPKGNNEVEFARAKECGFKEEKGAVVELAAGSQSELSDIDMQQVAGFKKLKALALFRQKVTDKGLLSLAPLKRLESLSIRECEIKGTGFAKLDLPRLKNLNFGRKNADAVLKNCGHLTGLREVDVHSTDLTDKGLKSLAQFPSLEKLLISSCPGVNGSALQHLRELKLKKIDAADNKFTAVGFQALLGLTHLRDLSLSYARFPLGEIGSLVQLKRLQTLRIGGAKVSEEQLEFLGRLRQLKELSLNGCAGVTDKTIELIAGLPKLESLRVSSTSITSKAEAILASLPRLIHLDASQTGLPRAAIKRLDKLLEAREDAAG